MDPRYSIGTTNRYALFLGEEDESADPQDIRKLVEVEKARKALKPVSVGLKENKINSKDVKESAEVRKPLGDKVAKNASSEDMERVKNRRNREEKPNNEVKARNGDLGPRPRRDENAPRKPRRDSERREGEGNEPRGPRRERRDWTEGEVEGRPDRRGTAPGKPRPRQTTPNNRRKREFERKSGSDKTGVKPVDKREGGGAHNWGTHKDDLAATGIQNAENVSSDEIDTSDPKLENEKENNTENKDPGTVDEAAEEVEVLTLDEYRARRTKRQQPQFNLRKAGEGEDLTQWKDLVEMKKKKEQENSDDDEELENLEFPQRVGRQKHVLGIDITFNDTRRGGRPARGPRPPREGKERREGTDGKFAGRKPYSGPREGRRPADDDNGNRREAAIPRVDDEKAFPSLG